MGRPLLDTKPDAALFAGRGSELDRLLPAARAGRNVLVVADRGAGTTSLLHQFARHARRTRPVLTPRFRNAATARTPTDLLRGLFGDPDRPPTPSGPYPAFGEYHDLPAGTVAIVDNISADLARDLFGRLRDEVWAIPATWVVSCPTHQQAAILEPPADAFFDVVLTVGHLSEIEARDLLVRRGAPADRLAELVTAGGGNPRQLIRALGAAESGERPATARRARLSRPAAMLLGELDSLGSASASDAELQHRLGWTRSRLTQVFRELLAAGMVTAGQVKGGIGRPRTVYRVAGTEGT